jgi:hypothetical protein
MPQKTFKFLQDFVPPQQFLRKKLLADHPMKASFFLRIPPGIAEYSVVHVAESSIK